MRDVDEETHLHLIDFFLMFFERVLGVPQEESAPVLDQILTAPPVFPHETMFQKGGEA
jgi:purine nucleosidase